MKNRKALAVLLAAAISLTGCSYVTASGTAGKTKETEKTGIKTTAEPSAQETAPPEETVPSEEIAPSGETSSSGEEEEDLHTALFRSGAYVVQMEITTGLTTEYLDPLCNYPVKLFADGREETIEDEEDLKKIGLDTLYSDGLVAAVGDFDGESMKIEGGRAVMGDDLYYVVLEMDEYENVGITEFHS